MGVNAILTDWLPEKDWDFKRYLSEFTGQSWVTVSLRANKLRKGKLDKLLNVYARYFLLPLFVFFKRKRYKNIIAWQQFFGIILAFYCNIFKVKKYPQVYILTFIFKDKKGVIGKIYYNFIKSAIRSKYVYKLICYSSEEREYYIKCFNLNPEKIVNITYGISNTMDMGKYKEHKSNKYFLSAGRSNRDYDFLIDALKNSEDEVVILCDEMKPGKTGNIKIYNDVFGEEYLKYLSNCFAVIIPLKDVNISSGQLVFLRAMEFGKPIIITEGKAIKDYIINGYNGIVIPKAPNNLIEAMNLLKKDEAFYKKMSDNCVELFAGKFSMKGFAETLAGQID